MDVNYDNVWLSETGKKATGAVTVEYELGMSGDGCCELCYTEFATVEFWLVCGKDRVAVSASSLGLTER